MRNLKRVLALIMVLSLTMSVNAFAYRWTYDDEPTRSYEDSVTKLTSILDGTDDQSFSSVDVQLTEDVVFSEDINVNGKDVTLDLNGHSLSAGDPWDAGIVVGYSGTDGATAEPSGSTLTVTGNGEIRNYWLQVGEQNGAYAGTLTFDENFTGTANFYELTPYVCPGSIMNLENGTMLTDCLVLDPDATFNMSGGLLDSQDSDSFTIQSSDDSIINITGGTLNSNKGYTLWVDGADLSISGSSYIKGNIDYYTDPDASITGGRFSTDVSGLLSDDYTQLNEAVGDYFAGQVVSKTDLAAEQARISAAAEAARAAAQAAARQAAAEEAARLAAAQEAALAGDDSSDDLDPATPSRETNIPDEGTPLGETPSGETTIEEVAPPLAAMPVDFSEEEAVELAELAVNLGLADEGGSYEAASATTAETVASVIENLASESDSAAATILSDAGIKEGDTVSREQFATVIYALAAEQDCDVTARASLERFNDADAVSAFAKEALEWAVSAGIYQGDDEDNLNPTDTLTYEQLLLIVSRYLAVISAQ